MSLPPEGQPSTQHRAAPRTRGRIDQGFRLAKRRAQMRWNRLVGSPGSRLERYMKPWLRNEQWAEFVAHENSHYRDAFGGCIPACTGHTQVCGAR
eukprot:4317811-Prymnesium_polylepis.1